MMNDLTRVTRKLKGCKESTRPYVKSDKKLERFIKATPRNLRADNEDEGQELGDVARMTTQANIETARNEGVPISPKDLVISTDPVFDSEADQYLTPDIINGLMGTNTNDMEYVLPGDFVPGARRRSWRGSLAEELMGDGDEEAAEVPGAAAEAAAPQARTERKPRRAPTPAEVARNALNNDLELGIIPLIAAGPNAEGFRADMNDLAQIYADAQNAEPGTPEQYTPYLRKKYAEKAFPLLFSGENPLYDQLAEADGAGATGLDRILGEAYPSTDKNMTMGDLLKSNPRLFIETIKKRPSSGAAGLIRQLRSMDHLLSDDQAARLLNEFSGYMHGWSGNLTYPKAVREVLRTYGNAQPGVEYDAIRGMGLDNFSRILRVLRDKRLNLKSPISSWEGTPEERNLVRTVLYSNPKLVDRILREGVTDEVREMFDNLFGDAHTGTYQPYWNEELGGDIGARPRLKDNYDSLREELLSRGPTTQFDERPTWIKGMRALIGTNAREERNRAVRPVYDPRGKEGALYSLGVPLPEYAIPDIIRLARTSKKKPYSSGYQEFYTLAMLQALGLLKDSGIGKRMMNSILPSSNLHRLLDLPVTDQATHSIVNQMQNLSNWYKRATQSAFGYDPEFDKSLRGLGTSATVYAMLDVLARYGVDEATRKAARTYLRDMDSYQSWARSRQRPKDAPYDSFEGAQKAASIFLRDNFDESIMDNLDDAAKATLMNRLESAAFGGIYKPVFTSALKKARLPRSIRSMTGRMIDASSLPDAAPPLSFEDMAEAREKHQSLSQMIRDAIPRYQTGHIRRVADEMNYALRFTRPPQDPMNPEGDSAVPSRNEEFAQNIVSTLRTVADKMDRGEELTPVEAQVLSTWGGKADESDVLASWLGVSRDTARQIYDQLDLGGDGSFLASEDPDSLRSQTYMYAKNLLDMIDARKGVDNEIAKPPSESGSVLGYLGTRMSKDITGRKKKEYQREYSDEEKEAMLSAMRKYNKAKKRAEEKGYDKVYARKPWVWSDIDFGERYKPVEGMLSVLDRYAKNAATPEDLETLYQNGFLEDYAIKGAGSPGDMRRYLKEMHGIDVPKGDVSTLVALYKTYLAADMKWPDGKMPEEVAKALDFLQTRGKYIDGEWNFGGETAPENISQVTGLTELPPMRMPKYWKEWEEINRRYEPTDDDIQLYEKMPAVSTLVNGLSASREHDKFMEEHDGASMKEYIGDLENKLAVLKRTPIDGEDYTPEMRKAAIQDLKDEIDELRSRAEKLGNSADFATRYIGSQLRKLDAADDEERIDAATSKKVLADERDEAAYDDKSETTPVREEFKNKVKDATIDTVYANIALALANGLDSFEGRGGISKEVIDAAMKGDISSIFPDESTLDDAFYDGILEYNDANRALEDFLPQFADVSRKDLATALSILRNNYPTPDDLEKEFEEEDAIRAKEGTTPKGPANIFEDEAARKDQDERDERMKEAEFIWYRLLPEMEDYIKVLPDASVSSAQYAPRSTLAKDASDTFWYGGGPKEERGPAPDDPTRQILLNPVGPDPAERIKAWKKEGRTKSNKEQGKKPRGESRRRKLRESATISNPSEEHKKTIKDKGKRRLKLYPDKTD